MMSDINIKCMSLANGTLSPALRLNYEFGQILGVDDFRQEQLYFLEKDYLYNRALHGYGTVYGLKVTATRPPDNDQEVLVAVQPGLGLDQWGRPIVVRDEQCARLGAWLATQPPEVIAEHQGPSAELSVYVVASFDECSDRLIPIPGEPCSDSEKTQAPSRIRDSFKLELRWQPPQMPAWAVVRRFARLMALVRIEPNLPPAESDEERLVTIVGDLDNPDALDAVTGSDIFASPPEAAPVFRLPAETARQILDRIFTVWVTEVRPRLRPNLTAPSESAESAEAEPGILLARLDFVPDAPFDAGNPQIPMVLPPDDTGRPFLLHTQLIQELLFLGGGDVAGGVNREFATLEVLGSRLLRLWIHHPTPVAFSDDPTLTLAVTSNEQSMTIDQVNLVPGVENLFQIVIDPSQAISPGARVALSIRLASLQESGGRSLLESLEGIGYDYLNREAGIIMIYATAGPVPTTRDLVTFDTVVVSNQPRLRLWFHTDRPVQLPNQLTVGRGSDAQSSNFGAAPSGGGPFSFVWDLTPPSSQPLRNDELLTLAFETDRVRVAPNLELNDLIQRNHLSFVGYDGDQTITLFYHVDLPQPPPSEGPDLEEILRAVALRLPALPFVTITSQFSIQQPLFELWFHLDLRPEEDILRVDPERFLEERPLRVFIEVEDPGTPIPLSIQNIGFVQHNVFSVRFDPVEMRNIINEFELNRLYLRFVFGLDLELQDQDGNSIGPLGNLIKESSIKFTGHNGQKTIVAYVSANTRGGNIG